MGEDFPAMKFEKRACQIHLEGSNFSRDVYDLLCWLNFGGGQRVPKDLVVCVIIIIFAS